MTTGTPERRFAALEGRDDFVLQEKQQDGSWACVVNQEYLKHSADRKAKHLIWTSMPKEITK